MSDEATAIEMIWDVAAELTERGDEKQAVILQACADALYSDSGDNVDFIYLEVYKAVRFIAEKHGLLP